MTVHLGTLVSARKGGQRLGCLEAEVFDDAGSHGGIGKSCALVRGEAADDCKGEFACSEACHGQKSVD
jgi:hypothetical protein